jgi:hypothetical protein
MNEVVPRKNILATKVHKYIHVLQQTLLKHPTPEIPSLSDKTNPKAPSWVVTTLVKRKPIQPHG